MELLPSWFVKASAWGECLNYQGERECQIAIAFTNQDGSSSKRTSLENPMEKQGDCEQSNILFLDLLLIVCLSFERVIVQKCLERVQRYFDIKVLGKDLKIVGAESWRVLCNKLPFFTLV